MSQAILPDRPFLASMSVQDLESSGFQDYTQRVRVSGSLLAALCNAQIDRDRLPEGTQHIIRDCRKRSKSFTDGLLLFNTGGRFFRDDAVHEGCFGFSTVSQTLVNGGGRVVVILYGGWESSQPASLDCHCVRESYNSEGWKKAGNIIQRPI